MVKKCIFFNIWSEIGIKNIISDIELYKPEKIIIFSQEEFELGGSLYDIKCEDIEEKLVKYNIKLYIIFGSGNCIDDFYKKNKTILPIINTEIVLWPMFWLYYTNLLISNYRNNIISIPNYKIDKLFISLNNRSHIHRCQLMDEIFHFELNNYANLTWNIENEEYNFKYWKQEKLFLDIFTNTYNIPEQYKISLINLVSETTLKVPFITEKTFMTILLAQPFIIYGAKGIHKLLIEYGFELYDEIFDYSFDEEKYDDQRLYAIIDNLIKIKDEKYQDIRHILEPKIRKNMNHALNIINNNKYIPELVVDIISKYREELEELGILNYIDL